MQNGTAIHQETSVYEVCIQYEFIIEHAMYNKRRSKHLNVSSAVRYKAVNFSLNVRNRHKISCQWVWSVLWVSRVLCVSIHCLTYVWVLWLYGVSKWISKQGMASFQWRYNERDSVSNHRRLDCLLNRLITRRSKKTLKIRVTGLCVNSPHKSQ